MPPGRAARRSTIYPQFKIDPKGSMRCKSEHWRCRAHFSAQFLNQGAAQRLALRQPHFSL